jgi:tRNA(Leu) C34 or U34 (ribose-2'-O)-methylase TrmL
MAVGIFKQPTNQMIATCQNFGHKLYVCKNILECFTRESNLNPVFCVDKQAAETLKKNHFHVYNLNAKVWDSRDNDIYIFGNDTGMLMGDLIKNLDYNKLYFRSLTINASINNVFWIESAMAIVLYESWRTK